MRRARRGTTLAEVVTASGVFLLLVLSLVLIALTTLQGWSRDGSQMMADGDGSLCAQRISQDVRDGLRATVATSGTSLTVVLPVLASSGDYDRLTEGDSVRYFLQDRTVYRQRGTGTAQVLARNIQSLQFTLSGGEIQIQLRARTRLGTAERDSTYTSLVQLRNEGV